MFNRRDFALSTLAASTLMTHGSVMAQTKAAWPTKPLRIVVGLAPGGLADVLVRNLNGEFDEAGMELRPEFRHADAAEDGEVTIHAIEIND